MVSQLSEKTHFFNNLGELMLYCRKLKGEKCEGKLLQNKSTENITGSLLDVLQKFKTLRDKLWCEALITVSNK